MIDWNWKVPDRVVQWISFIGTITGLCLGAWSVGIELQNAPNGSIWYALLGLTAAIFSCLELYSKALDKLASPDKIGIRLTIGFWILAIAYAGLGIMLVFGFRL